MSYRDSRFLFILLSIAFVFPYATFAKENALLIEKVSDIQVSPLTLEWSPLNKTFYLDFSVLNPTGKKTSLAGILSLEYLKFKRRETISLEKIEAYSADHYRLSVPASIFLERDYKGISFYLLDSQDKKVISKSNAHQYLASFILSQNKDHALLRVDRWSKVEGENTKSEVIKIKDPQNLKELGRKKIFPNLATPFAITKLSPQEQNFSTLKEEREKLFQQFQNKPTDLENLYTLVGLLEKSVDFLMMDRIRQNLLDYLENNSSNEFYGSFRLVIIKLTGLIQEKIAIINFQGKDLSLSFQEEVQLQAITPKKRIALHFKVKNSGTSSTTRFSVVYQLRNQKGQLFPLEEVSLFQGLKAKSSTRSWIVYPQAPDKLPMGIYQVVAKLQLLDSEVDLNEGNNQVASEYLFHYTQADLALTHLEYTSPKSLTEGETFKASVFFQNVGGTISSGSEIKLLLQNTREAKETYLIHEEALDAIPAISSLQKKNFDLVLPPMLKQGESYDLLAQLVSSHEKNDASPKNNLLRGFTPLKSNQNYSVRNFELLSDVVYPGRTVQMLLNVDTQLKPEEMVGTHANLTLVSVDGTRILWRRANEITFYMPKKRPNAKQTEKSSPIASISARFPRVKRGSYYVEIEILPPAGESAESLKVLSRKLISFKTSQVDLLKVYIENTSLVPKASFQFQIGAINQGGSISPVLPIDLYLVGEKRYFLGRTELKSLKPTSKIRFFQESLTVPANIPYGNYGLVARYGEKKEIMASSLIKLSPIEILSPHDYDSFSGSTIPYFRWQGETDLQYRLVFSTDRHFRNEGQNFEAPYGVWLNDNKFRPELGEWKMIWLLSQQGKKQIYWRLQSKSNSGKIFSTSPRKILLKTEKKTS